MEAWFCNEHTNKKEEFSEYSFESFITDRHIKIIDKMWSYPEVRKQKLELADLHRTAYYKKRAKIPENMGVIWK